MASDDAAIRELGARCAQRDTNVQQSKALRASSAAMFEGQRLAMMHLIPGGVMPMHLRDIRSFTSHFNSIREPGSKRLSPADMRRNLLGFLAAAKNVAFRSGSKPRGFWEELESEFPSLSVQHGFVRMVFASGFEDDFAKAVLESEYATFADAADPDRAAKREAEKAAEVAKAAEAEKAEKEKDALILRLLKENAGHKAAGGGGGGGDGGGGAEPEGDGGGGHVAPPAAAPGIRITIINKVKTSGRKLYRKIYKVKNAKKAVAGAVLGTSLVFVAAANIGGS